MCGGLVDRNSLQSETWSMAGKFHSFSRPTHLSPWQAQGRVSALPPNSDRIPETIANSANRFESHTLVTKYNSRNVSANAELQNQQPRSNADSFALFAVWAWIMQQQQKSCPQSYPLWNVTNGIENLGTFNTTDLGTPASSPENGNP